MKTDKEFLVKGSLINSLGLITRVISPLLVVLLARVYTQKDFGLFISFQAMALTLARLAILSLDRGLLWNVPKVRRDSPTSNTGLADSLYLSTILSALIFLVMLLATATGLFRHIAFLREVPLPFLLLMTASIWPFVGVQLFASALEGLRQPQYRVFIALFLTTSMVPLIALGLRHALGATMSLGAGMFLGNLIGFLLFIPVIRSRFPDEPWLRPRRPARALLRYSLPLAMSDLVLNLWSRVDLWMILFFLGPEKVALYSVMTTVTNGLKTVRQTFDPLIIPIVSNLQAHELDTKLKSSFSYATNMVSSIQLCIACFILFFPKEILSLAGKAYAIEIFAFALLLMGNLANGFLGMNGLILLGMGRSKQVLALSIGALCLNLLCNWIFVPRLGVVGAALSASLVLFLHNLSYYLFVRVGYKLRLYEPHLYINAGLELGFLTVLFLCYHRIEAQALPARVILFSAVAFGLACILFLKRKTYVLS